MFTQIADTITSSLLSLEKETHLGQVVHFFIEDILKIFVLLFLITTIVSFFRSHLHSEKVRDYLNGKPKWIAYIFAVILGAVTPFCSCSSIPLFIGFVEAGIPFGITMAFLITSPMINEVAMIVLGADIGWKLAGIYILTGMSIGLLGGLFMEKMKWGKYIEDYVFDIKMGKLKNKSQKMNWKDRVFYALDYSKDIIKKIWIYIFIGVGIGAFIHGFIPQDFFTKYTSKENVFAVPLAVLLGIPLYSNATGIIPIAKALLLKSVPVGTVLAMMMSIVAISFPELIILRKVLKVRLLIYFVLFLLFAFTVVGYLYNFILS